MRVPVHPNCRHVLTPYVRELDPDAEETQEYSNTSLTKDPRSEKEKQAYQEMRDQRTLATTRMRLRELLLSDNVSTVEKAKLALKLKKTYEGQGKKPTGLDASLIKTWANYLFGGLENPEEIIETIRAEIKAGKYNLKINQSKQNRHTEGTKEYQHYLNKLQRENKKPNILYVDAQDFVNKYHGTGEIVIQSMRQPPKEKVTVDFIVGKVYNEDTGEYIDTNRAMVVYSKAGTHVYPIKPVIEGD